MPPHTRPYESVLDTIGWTPLIRLTRVTAGIRTPIYGKAEFFNPGGSVKDRKWVQPSSPFRRRHQKAYRPLSDVDHPYNLEDYACEV